MARGRSRPPASSGITEQTELARFLTMARGKNRASSGTTESTVISVTTEMPEMTVISDLCETTEMPENLYSHF